MSVKPILFNDEMVRAILAGRKTQTRRPLHVNPIPSILEPGLYKVWKKNVAKTNQRRRQVVDRSSGETLENTTYFVPLKQWLVEDFAKYRVGDILWVRECWAPASEFDPSPETGAIFRSTTSDEFSDVVKWRPSIHMPRWAARLFLKVTNVRCQKLLDISKADAIAEGFKSKNDFILAFDSIYEAKQDQLVFAYTFERCEKPVEGA